MSDAPLKLLAFDAEDLKVLSVHLQDAELKVGDLVFLPRERRFAFAADRFDWEASATEKTNRRRRTAVHFEGVTSVRSRGLDLENKEAPLTLLALAFDPGEAPAGSVHMLFLNGGCVKLDVECVEAAFKDLGPTWTCTCCPSHPEVENQSQSEVA
ncbi:DUF2948 family protein [Terrihabitans sp. B22-R8]|uniref:DUF2948 family protein n=1 Tax=Terrihabitans sp. B22-R8 TaxID=3425128 RepID=UPI00403CCC52